MDMQAALAKAREQKPRVNHYTEYRNSFVFDYDEGIEMDGGDSPIVVPKNGGECTYFLFALTNTDYLDGDIIAEGMI